MKCFRNVVLLSVFSFILSMIIFNTSEAKNIYFSGEYGNNNGCSICMSEYSGPTPEEIRKKEVGTYTVNVPHAYGVYEGVLVKNGKNKYRTKDKGLVIKVYKKKIVVTVKNKRKYDKELRGTYKLVSRYYS